MTEKITLVIDVPRRVCYFLKIFGDIISLFQKHIKLPIHSVTSPRPEDKEDPLLPRPWHREEWYV